MSWENNMRTSLICGVVCGVILLGLSVLTDPSVPLNDQGVCTDKYVSNGTSYVKLNYNTYSISPELYNGMIIGEGYRVYGHDGHVEDIQKYAEDSGL
jgi:hypothetical protein